ncbi:MAG: M23 family metallopeptidase [Campylobacteraceae bacterium]|nr:M23 family metallopeptidase [Campylobacteraceae bacterium]
MVRKIILSCVLTLNLVASGHIMQEFEWPSGKTLLSFLEDAGISLSLYYDLEATDKELAAEIVAGTKCEILLDSESKMDQILIPITEDLQIHIYKEDEENYALTFAPTIYNEGNFSLGIEIENSPYLDINKATGNGSLSAAFSRAFSNNVDFRKLQKGDNLALYYTQKERLGKPYGDPIIHAGMIEENGKSKYIYYFDSKYYDEKGKVSETLLFTLPVPGARVSSKFSPKRFHPVLKRYRAHLGTDYAAKKGTPIKAIGEGTVIFVGKKGGYGNTVEVQHKNGYKSLYAHVNNYAKGLKKGKKVRQGEVIAYVGNTGLSTGPHLHLGLYKNNKAIDFEKAVKVAKEVIEFGKEEKKRFQDYIKAQNEKLQAAMGGYHNPPKFVAIDNFIEF